MEHRAEFVDGGPGCLLVYGVGNVVVLFQILFEGDEVERIDLQGSAGAGLLGLTLAGNHNDESLVLVIRCQFVAVGERKNEEELLRGNFEGFITGQCDLACMQTMAACCCACKRLSFASSVCLW